MNWAENSWLYALSFPAIVAIGLLTRRFLHRGGRAVRWPGIKRVLASPGGLKPVPTATSGRRPWLLLIAIVGVIIALARPQWGEIEEPVFDHAREVMIALDLSRSMMVDDVPPSRLVRSRLLVQTLLGELRGERVGLIVFAGTSFVQVPMSSDYQILNEFLPEMDADYMPQGGTDYAGMLKSALEGFSEKENTDRYLITLSDGESQTGDWRAHLPALRERDIRVITLGVGTPGGGFIPDGNTGFKKDERGAVVLSKLEPATLQALAAETGGVYRDASSWVDLKTLLEETVARGREGSFVEERSVRHVDRFQWFLGPALALAFLGLWREVSVRPRVKKIRQTPPAIPKSVGKRAAAVTAAIGGFACALSLAPSRVAAADAPEQVDPSTPVRESVGRVSALANPTARDWLELAETTLAFGNELKAAQQQVPAGPVVDAISAATLGQSIDPALTDWDQLLAGLNELLEPPPEQQQDDQQEQENEEENEDQEKSEQEQSQDGENENNEENSQENEQEQSSENKDGSEGDPSESEQQEGDDQQSGENNDGESRQSPQSQELGDLEEPEEQQDQQPSPPQQPQQPDEKKKFGGRPAESVQQPPMDAKTAAAMQKLREVIEGDSPAQLFEILEGESKKQGETGRDW